VYEVINDAPERVANFSDPSSRREVILDKFLRRIDDSLDIILNAYHLPLFVLGSEKVLGHFKNMTKHAGSVIEYIHGNYDDITPAQLGDVLAPYTAQWKKVREKDLLHQLDEAAGRKKLASGMREVWKTAMSNKGRLLVVEKDYMFAAQRIGKNAAVYLPDTPYHQFSNIRDAVDEVIEKVLETGGDVEFVDRDVLKDHYHIALVKYY
jgi:hypothetical protein